VPFKEIPNDRQSVKNWWGVDGGTPPLVVKRIEFRVANKEIPIPLAAYVDFGDIGFPPQMQLQRRGRTLHLSVTAGDAAGSYIAELIFRGRKLVERRMRLGEFPEHVTITKF
jgi:hypothetical protein